MTSAATSSLDGLYFVIRDKAADDAMAIHEATRAALRDHPFSQQTEHLIFRGPREAGALNLSLVGRVVRHLAFSPVKIGAMDSGWWGLGRCR